MTKKFVGYTTYANSQKYFIEWTGQDHAISEFSASFIQ